MLSALTSQLLLKSKEGIFPKEEGVPQYQFHALSIFILSFAH